MAPCSRALVTLPEGLGSVPRTHVTAHNYLSLQVQGIQHILPASVGTRLTCGTHI